jgi:hypothetical protein
MSLDLDQEFKLSRHADLKQRRDGAILVLPERAIRIGGSGEEILRLCLEGRAGREIVSLLRDRYPDSSDVTAEVTTFLDKMLELGGLVVAKVER